VPSAVSGAESLHKSELGAIATSRALTFPVGVPHFYELTLRLVAIAPSSDFAITDNSILLAKSDFLCKVSSETGYDFGTSLHYYELSED
jgi:hypothetical protein